MAITPPPPPPSLNDFLVCLFVCLFLCFFHPHPNSNGLSLTYIYLCSLFKRGIERRQCFQRHAKSLVQTGD